MNVAHTAPAVPQASPAYVVRLRGPLAVLAAVALVLGVPSLAYATFTAQTTAAVTVGTYKIPAPASITGTLQCSTFRGQKGAIIRITDFGKVYRATGYTATLKAAGGTVSAKPAAVGGATEVSLYNGAGQYTFSLTAQIGSWTGLPLQQKVTC